MKKLFNKIEDMLADAALLEMGVPVLFSAKVLKRSFAEALEENFVEIAYAEAADYEEIHEALVREHREALSEVHPDDCQYGDNDLCFASA